MKFSQMTDAELKAAMAEIRQVLAGRKTGAKRQLSAAEIRCLFLQHHDKFVQEHEKLGGKTFPDCGRGDDFDGPWEGLFDCYLNFLESYNNQKVARSKSPYFSVRYEKESGRSNMPFVSVTMTSLFGEEAYLNDNWDSNNKEERSWIVVEKDGEFRSPSAAYIKKLAKRLGLVR